MGSTEVKVNDVARHANVSLGTVSNVLNRPDKVSHENRVRVHPSIQALGFVRNESARQLRAGHSRTVGFLVLDVRNPFFTDVARGAERAASESGSALLIANSGEHGEKELSYPRPLRGAARPRGLDFTRRRCLRTTYSTPFPWHPYRSHR